MTLSNDLGKDSIIKLVLGLALPAMTAQLVSVLYNIVDRMYIGQIPEIGAVALAGVGICSPIVGLLSSFGTLVGIGGSVLLAMYMGAGEEGKARDILSNSFMLLTAFSIILTVSFLIMKNKLIYIFGASDITFQYANTYLTIYTIGCFFALMAMGLNYFIVAQGFAAIGMLTVSLGAIVNIILDTVFIFKFNFGVAGAAWATVIAQMCSFIFAFLFLISKRIKVKITYGNYSKNYVKQILRYGLSLFIIIAFDSGIIIIMNVMLQKFGGSASGDLLISVATISQSYLLLIIGPLAGLTAGTQPILSFNYGARNYTRIRQAEKAIMMFGFVFTVIMFLFTPILSGGFIRLFTDNEELTELSKWGVRVFTLGIIPLSFQYAWVDCLTALGKVKPALFLSTFRKSIYIGGAMIIPIVHEAKNALYAEPLADITSASMSLVIYLFLFKRYLKKEDRI